MLVAEVYQHLNKYDDFKSKLPVEDPINNFSKVSLEIIEQAKVSMPGEIEIRANLSEQRFNNRIKVVHVLLDTISEHTMENKHDIPLLSLIERWTRFYKDEEEELLKLTNFLANRILLMNSEGRAKCMVLLYKTLEMRAKLHKEGDIAPFLNTKEEHQQQDIIYILFSTNGQEFAQNFIEIIMRDLGVKEDNRLITNDGSSTKMAIKTTVRKGKNKRTVTRIVSNKVSRHFRIFNCLFKFYGIKIFKDNFYPVLKEYESSKFEGKDHPNIWKLIIFDIICAFWRTSDKFYQSDPELYDNCLTLLYKLFDHKASSEIRGLFRDALVECFHRRDPNLIDKFIMKMTNELPSNSSSKSEKNFELLNNFIMIFKWRYVPYLEHIIDRLMD